MGETHGSQNRTARLAALIELACLAEATARKPGNVHPEASFEDLDHSQFVAAARLSSPHLANANGRVGESVWDAVKATRDSTGTNVNLGICLAIAPLAAVGDDRWPDVSATLSELTVEDARNVYRAIRIASPGGLGEVSSQDVSDDPDVTLLQAMQLAADYDGIAELYATSFAEVFEFAVPTLLSELEECDAESAIVRLAVHWQARSPDTHIARRAGRQIANEAAGRAAEVVKDWSKLAAFDEWLREDGHKRNPGTTADIVAATVFAALRGNSYVEIRLCEWLEGEGLC